MSSPLISTLEVLVARLQRRLVYCSIVGFLLSNSFHKLQIYDSIKSIYYNTRNIMKTQSQPPQKVEDASNIFPRYNLLKQLYDNKLTTDLYHSPSLQFSNELLKEYEEIIQKRIDDQYQHHKIRGKGIQQLEKHIQQGELASSEIAKINQLTKQYDLHLNKERELRNLIAKIDEKINYYEIQTVQINEKNNEQVAAYIGELSALKKAYDDEVVKQKTYLHLKQVGKAQLEVINQQKNEHQIYRDQVRHNIDTLKEYYVRYNKQSEKTSQFDAGQAKIPHDLKQMVEQELNALDDIVVSRKIRQVEHDLLEQKLKKQQETKQLQRQEQEEWRQQQQRMTKVQESKLMDEYEQKEKALIHACQSTRVANPQDLLALNKQLEEHNIILNKILHSVQEQIEENRTIKTQKQEELNFLKYSFDPEEPMQKTSNFDVTTKEIREQQEQYWGEVEIIDKICLSLSRIIYQFQPSDQKETSIDVNKGNILELIQKWTKYIKKVLERVDLKAVKNESINAYQIEDKPPKYIGLYN